MKLRARTFWCPKAGNSAEQYEDAWHVSDDQACVAMADGATDAFASSRWARALVQNFVAQPPDFDAQAMPQWLELCIAAWRSQIRWAHLPWYAEEKAAKGAFATLLGLVFEQPEEQVTGQAVMGIQWRAMAIGDACLFHVRHDELLSSFPLQHSREFGNAPPLLSTRLDYNQKSLGALQITAGELLPGDTLILATDAWAAWLLGNVEAGNSPTSCITGLNEAVFPERIDELRRLKLMRNDDVTLLVLQPE